jgi:predicted deacylase
MQIGMIEKAYEGFQNLLIFLNMLPLRAIERPPKPTWVLCSHSRWFYTDVGGILVVHCEIGTWVRKDECLATIYDCFGDHVKHFVCREDCIVVGKSVLPTASAGDRIVHLGFVTGNLEKTSLDGHE